VATVALRSDGQAGEFALTQRAVAALTELLNGYTDPDDFGFCARCNGRRLDHNLRCRDCGYVNGIFGLVVAERGGRRGPAGKPDRLIRLIRLGIFVSWPHSTTKRRPFSHNSDLA